MALPTDCLWGIHTERAIGNFPISGIPLAHFPEFVRSLAWVKTAAARANVALGVLEPAKAEVIVAVCAEIIAGRHHEHFRVDMIQGGAGTSTNMNANEVIANLGLLRMGRAPGDYAHLHPNDDVNRSQSTNDVYPTAMRLAIVSQCAAFQDGAAAAVGGLRRAGGGLLGREEDRADAVAGRAAHDARGRNSGGSPRPSTRTWRSSGGCRGCFWRSTLAARPSGRG